MSIASHSSPSSPLPPANSEGNNMGSNNGDVPMINSNRAGGTLLNLQMPEVQPVQNQPIGFPNAVIHNSVVRRVQLDDGSLHDVLETVTENFYEFGRKLKESIYGYVFHAVSVTKNPDGSYTRTQPLRQFAIKVYTRQRLILIINGVPQEVLISKTYIYY